MKKLQELRTWLEAERVNASGYSEIKKRGEGYQSYWGGKANAFTQCINKLDLLLAQHPNEVIAPPLPQAAVSGSLPLAEQGATDEFGHHSEWKFCPGCGMDWDVKTGADEFGCWNCGFVRQ